MPPSHVHNNVPHLQTFITGPLRQLEKQLLDNQVIIEKWLRLQWQLTPALMTTSVDLRNAGFKLAPVDTNLFPAGFNNLTDGMISLSIQAAQHVIEKHLPGCEKILLIPENHTRNIFYFESLTTLQTILTHAGFEVRIGSLLPEITQKTDYMLPSGKKVILEPLQQENGVLKLADFTPCLILLNNDLSNGIPTLLQQVKQPMLPSLELGWFNRLKSEHFKHYAQVATEFAALLQLDPWLINPLFRHCGEVNFLTAEGEDCLISNVEVLLAQIKENYLKYSINENPFVIVKADRGTYGMAVMTVENIDQIMHLNRKERGRMASLKGKQSVTQVIIQEGVYTFETYGKEEAVAEPVVYMLGQHVVGGFYRIHKNRGPKENLNAPGMQFEPLAFVTPCNYPDETLPPNEIPNRFYAYGVIARLAALAAAREAKTVSPAKSS